MKVADGIERVEGTRVGNAYVVVVDDGLMLVDTGTFGGAERILSCVRRLGRGASEVRTIVLTHWHPDHIGNAAQLREATGAAIAIHQLDAPLLAGGELPPKGRRAMRLFFRLLRIRSVVADITLRSGDTIAGLEVIHVPGHTAGSIALRRDDGVVFSGDALLGDRRGRVRLPDPRLSLDPTRAMASATAIMTLRPRVLLPGHGAPVHSDGRV